jgi:beta-mannanase
MKNTFDRIRFLPVNKKGGSESFVKTVLLSFKNFPFFLSLIFFPVVTNPEQQPIATQTGQQIYWGGYLDGDQYGLGDAPWETRTIETFEANAGKRLSIIHWGQFWHWSRQSGYSSIGDGHFQRFDSALYERVRQHGAIPMVNWNSWSADAGGSSSQPNFQLIDIINGDYDAYIRRWARDAKAWGKPFFLRFDHEMNGSWYPWSERANGNQPGQYAQMWRHVHNIFRQEGADNVTWVWSVNTVYSASSRDLAGLYPGDEYVDWVAIDGYNWGANPSKPEQWKSFSQVFKETYDLLGQVAPDKPIMLSEFSSTEYGGSKADWISDALAVQIPIHFPRIKAVVWFNWNCYEGSGKMDWVIESSSSAQKSFATGIQSPYYASNDFANLPAGKVQPLNPRQAGR